MDDKADRIIKEHVLWAIGAGLLPLPIVDIVAVSAIQLDMLKQLASAYSIRITESEGKAWVSALVGNTAARIGAHALKLVPGLGTLLGGLSVSILSGASTYAVGKVAAGHFANGGTLGTIDMAAARRTYDEELERGKAVAKDLSSQKKDTIEKLERLAKLRDKGVLSQEEFEAQKKRVLSEG